MLRRGTDRDGEGRKRKVDEIDGHIFGWCGANVSNDWLFELIILLFVDQFATYLGEASRFGAPLLLLFLWCRSSVARENRNPSIISDVPRYVRHHANLRTWHWLSRLYVTLKMLLLVVVSILIINCYLQLSFLPSPPLRFDFFSPLRARASVIFFVDILFLSCFASLLRGRVN